MKEAQDYSIREATAIIMQLQELLQIMGDLPYLKVLDVGGETAKEMFERASRLIGLIGRRD